MSGHYLDHMILRSKTLIAFQAKDRDDIKEMLKVHAANGEAMTGLRGGAIYEKLLHDWLQIPEGGNTDGLLLQRRKRVSSQQEQVQAEEQVNQRVHTQHTMESTVEKETMKTWIMSFRNALNQDVLFEVRWTQEMLKQRSTDELKVLMDSVTYWGLKCLKKCPEESGQLWQSHKYWANTRADESFWGSTRALTVTSLLGALHAFLKSCPSNYTNMSSCELEIYGIELKRVDKALSVMDVVTQSKQQKIDYIIAFQKFILIQPLPETGQEWQDLQAAIKEVQPVFQDQAPVEEEPTAEEAAAAAAQDAATAGAAAAEAAKQAKAAEEAAETEAAKELAAKAAEEEEKSLAAIGDFIEAEGKSVLQGMMQEIRATLSSTGSCKVTLDMDIPQEVRDWVSTGTDKERQNFQLNIAECSVNAVKHDSSSNSLRFNLAANMNSSGSVCLYDARKHADMPAANSVVGKGFSLAVKKRGASKSPDGSPPASKKSRQTSKRSRK